MLKTQIASPARNVLRGMKGNQVRTFIMRKYNPEFISHDANMLATLTGRVGVVGIAIGYELDGPGIESRWGRNFPHLSKQALGPPSLLYNGYRVFFRG